MSKLNLTVKLVGEDGNIFNLIRIVRNEMKKHGHDDLVPEFTQYIMNSRHFEEAIFRISEWVDII